MKVLFLSVLLFLNIQISLSQNISLSWSEETQNKNGMIPSYILGEWNNEIYIVNDQSGKTKLHPNFSLDIYSLGMKRLSSSEFKLPDIHERGEQKILNIFLVKGNIILFFDNKKVLFSKPYSKVLRVQYSCYCVMLDKMGEKIADPITLVDELQETDIMDKDAPESKKCNVLMSVDSSAFLLYSDNVINGKMSVQLIDTKLNVINKQILSLPFIKSFSLSNFILDSNQNLYLTSKEKSLTPKQFVYKVLLFDLKNKTFKSKTITTKSTFPLSLFHMNLYKDKLQLVSYYYNAVKRKASGGGIVYFEFSRENLEVKTAYESEFDATTMDHLNSNSKIFKDSYDNTENAINTLKHNKIINLQNDETIIISEQLIKLDVASTDGEDYFNILVTRIGKNGILNLPFVIPKLQSGLKKKYYSFLDIVKNNTLYLIYNENPKNLDNPDPYKINNGVNGVSGSVPVIVTVTQKDWTRKPLYIVDDNTSYIYPIKSYFDLSGGVIVYGQTEDKIKFAFIK